MFSFSLVVAVVALPPVLPLDQLQPGQKGECLTVFEGDDIESFPFVVKRIIRNMNGPGKHVVMVRLLGEKAEFTGVVAGMSGSPCTVDGRLLGALGYAFGMFTKEPIGGITPIGGMLDVMTLPDEARPWRLPDTSEGDWQALRQGKAPPTRALAAVSGMSDQGMRPIATPLSLGGVTPAVARHFEPWLRSVGFEPVQSGSGGAADGSSKPPPLRPGSPLAAKLVGGDVEIAATGTVTSVEGDEVIAFGHPLFGAGAISLPMARATIVNTIVSAMRSYKMSVTGPVVGELTQDRITGVGGFLSRKPQVITVSGEVVTPRGTSKVSLEVARDLGLSPRLLAIGLAGSLAGRIDVGERGIVRLDATIEAGGIEPVRIRDVYSGEREGALVIQPAMDIAQTFGALWDTPFGPPPLMHIQLRLELDPDPQEEWVEAVQVDREWVRAGGEVELSVRLRQRDGPVSHERFLLKVPKSWASEDIEFVAAGAGGANQLARRVEGQPRPTSLADIGRWLSKKRPNGYVYLFAVRPGTGLRSGVQEMPFLPPSAVVTLGGGDPARQPRTHGLAWEERRSRRGIVSGQARAMVKVSSR